MRKTGKDLRTEMDAKYAKEKKEYGGYEKYEVEGWQRTLQEASEILADPVKMKLVAKCMDKKEKSLKTMKGWLNSKGKQAQPDQDAD